MEHLKVRVEEASAAVEVERQQNVELLNLVFPADVAKQLWLGEGLRDFQCHAYNALL